MKYCPKCKAPITEQPIEGLKRQACSNHLCDFVFWNNPLPVVAVLIEYQEHILLARNQQWPAAMFSLITGFIECREDPLTAAVRETQEELGLKLELPSLIGIYNWPQMNQLIIAYSGKAEGELYLSAEIAEVKLIEPAKLRSWDFGVGPAVRDYLKASQATS
ncbi:NUDIX domain-containing protein [Pseudoalteromonas xiamenensis]|uniref:NUDIX domain-containing protein n=1 Tax=Pseudoalteromonas xiamenensis TaxID=882626 RepID=A0A975DKX1_9GAMM|nr:NUDIX domain-containing protein [Pseudoalteromonas xiamenensis]QTH73010.1 NUDIX domain-containing protein [Pseudoalteromonas xiamenensis]